MNRCDSGTDCTVRMEEDDTDMRLCRNCPRPGTNPAGAFLYYLTSKTRADSGWIFQQDKAEVRRLAGGKSRTDNAVMLEKMPEDAWVLDGK